MKLLVLGGTLFLGRHVVEAALARGHSVTTLTRGRTNSGVFADAEMILGDRDHDLDVLRDRTWDAVVDTSAYLPQQAVGSSRTLADAIGCYCLVSTASVYASTSPIGVLEDAPTHAPPVGKTDLTPELYGPLKVGCERAVLAAFGDAALIVRPGVLAGPHDPTGRFSYWVNRIAEGGEILAPGDPSHSVQVLDARDLAAWIVTMLEDQAGGVYNASGPAEPFTMGHLFEICARATCSDARFVWASDEFLLGNGVEPWSDLPFWLPRDVPGPLLDSSKARLAGLRSRPIAQTVNDVWAGDTDVARAASGLQRSQPLARSRERELLDLLRDDVDPTVKAKSVSRPRLDSGALGVQTTQRAKRGPNET